MPTSLSNRKVPKFTPGKMYWPDGQDLNDIWDAIMERTPIGGANVKIRPHTKGYIVDGSAGGNTTTCPFEATAVVVSSVRYARFRQMGFLNNIVPSNMFATSTLLSSFACANGDWVCLQVTTADNVISGVSIVVTSTTPAGIGAAIGAAPTAFKIPMYRMVDGTLMRLIGCGSLWATPEVILISDNPSAVCAGDPFERSYTWRLNTV